MNEKKEAAKKSMTLFLVLTLREKDNAPALIETLCDTLTNATYLAHGESLEFISHGDTILVYRSFPVHHSGKPFPTCRVCTE